MGVGCFDGVVILYLCLLGRFWWVSFGVFVCWHSGVEYVDRC